MYNELPAYNGTNLLFLSFKWFFDTDIYHVMCKTSLARWEYELSVISKDPKDPKVSSH